MSGIDGFTKLMLHMNGADGSTTFTDDSDSAHAITPTLAEIDTDQSVFGGASGLFNSATSRLTIGDHEDFNLGADDFVFDWRMKLSSLSGTQALITQWGGGGSNGSFYIVKLTGSNNLSFFYSPNGSSEVRNDSTYNIPDTNWHWYAIARSGNTLRFYVDGTQYGSADMTGVSIFNSTRPFNISTYQDGAGQPLVGWIDEFRFSKGTDRGFTGATIDVPTSAYTEPLAPVEVADNMTLTETVTTSVSLIKKTIAENLSLNESVSRAAIIYAIVEEFLTLNDATSVKQAISKAIIENLKLTEDYEKLVLKSVVDNIDLSEYINATPSLIKKSISESITLAENITSSVLQEVNYASQILHYNPLIFVTNTNPVKLVVVDISVPEIPVKSVYTLTGYSGASDIALNETNEYFYINVSGAKVLKIEKADLNNVTEIDLNDLDNLLNIDTLDDYFITYASTDDANGEIIKIDERDITKFNSDIRWLELISTTLSTRLNTIIGKKINSDLRYIAVQNKKLKTDLRWLHVPYAEINQTPISPVDIQIKINGVDLVPLNDIDMSTVQITHTIDEKSTATFRLCRRHDKLNYTNTGVASQITNNNTVIVIISGHTEFSGKISNIQADSETETVFIVAKMDTPSDSRHTVTIPMSSVGQNINLYHCMMNNLTIDNPYVDPLDENPEYYKGIKVQLGEKVGENVRKITDFEQIETTMERTGAVGMSATSVAINASEVENGTYKFKQGYTYFWFVAYENFITGKSRRVPLSISNIKFEYIGTSLGPISSDTYRIIGAQPIYQLVQRFSGTDLGQYTVGEAPFKLISTKNGKKVNGLKYQEIDDQLFLVREAGYNYVGYARRVADLEYEKLQNINGDILPIVNT
ncbi:MAG: LamG domain-containing protein, partial [Novosphingobium sp.]|nr:LamG domain-containing protein [Novosphingobium sp.]